MDTPEYLGALPVGYRLHEYEIVSVLGVGGFGITYLATDSQLGMRVAIKEYLPNTFAVRTDNSTVLPKSKVEEDNYRWGLDRFMKEAQTLARFRHPNIVRVLRFFEDNGTGYTVMEYEDGQSLAHYLNMHRAALSEAEILKLLLPLLDGLKLVHAAGFLHRDIKPANIYLRSDGAPVLIDFGSARQAMGTQTQNLTSVFTPGYAPFEQYFADGRQGPWTDIYALGAVLYRLVTGEGPPDSASRIKEDTLTPASIQAKGRYSAGFLHAIDQALLMSDEARPQSIDAWLDMLAATKTPASKPLNPATQPIGKTTVVRPTNSAGIGHATAGTTSVPSHHTTRPTTRTRRQPPPPKRSPLKTVALIVLVVVVAGGVFRHFNQHKAHATAAPQSDSVGSADNTPSTAPVDRQDSGSSDPYMDQEDSGQASDTANSDANTDQGNARQNTPGAPTSPTAQQAQAMPSQSAPRGQDRLDRRFTRADTNGDGYLSRSEAEAAFPRLARMFDRADLNHDGQLSEEEVREFTQRRPGRRFARRRQ